MNALLHLSTVELVGIAGAVAGIVSLFFMMYLERDKNRTASIVFGSVFAIMTLIFLQLKSDAPKINFSPLQDHVFRGSSTWLRWSVQPSSAAVYLNGNRATSSGEREVWPVKDTTYVLRAEPQDGRPEESNCTIHVLPAPVEVEFYPDRTEVRSGETVTVNWRVKGDASSATLLPNIGPVGLQGTRTIAITFGATLTLTATGPGGNASKEITFNIRNTDIEFSVQPSTVHVGEHAVLRWKTNADQVSIKSSDKDGARTVPREGSTDVNPGTTTTYTLQANGPGGERTADTALTVLPAKSPTLRAWIRPEHVQLGQSAEIGWTAEEASSVRIEGPDLTGNFAVSGSRTVHPGSIGDFRYSFTATGPGGDVPYSVLVSVTPPPPPPPARKPTLAVLGLEPGGVRNHAVVDQIVTDQLTRYLRSRYDLVAVTGNYQSVQGYLYSIRQYRDITVPDVIAYAIARAESNVKQRDYFVAQATRVEMTARATVRLIRVNDDAILAESAGTGKKSATISLQTPLGAGNSAPSNAKLEADVVEIAIADALARLGQVPRR